MDRYTQMRQNVNVGIKGSHERWGNYEGTNCGLGLPNEIGRYSRNIG